MSSREDNIFSYDRITNGNLGYKTKGYGMITHVMCDLISLIISFSLLTSISTHADYLILSCKV